jgi:MoxR-like ATPase
LLLIGEPGIAKSVIAQSVCDWIEGAKILTIHCMPDLTKSETFGPQKLSSLMKDQYDRNLEGGAADVEILILEEVYRAGPGVLNSFLLLMNERIIKMGLVHKKCPLIFLMGVGNHWQPEGGEEAVRAFADRFELRNQVEAIQTDKGAHDLVQLPVVGQAKIKRGHTPNPKSKITLEELKQANRDI